MIPLFQERESLNYQSYLVLSVQRKGLIIQPLAHRDKRDERRLASFHVHLPAGKPSISRKCPTANINKYSGSLTIECGAAFDRVRRRETLHRWRSCERRAKAWSGETKSRVTTQPPSFPLGDRRGLRVSGTRAAVEFRASERTIRSLVYLRLFTPPRPFVSASAKTLNSLARDSLFRAAVSAPPNKAAGSSSGWAEPTRSRLTVTRMILGSVAGHPLDDRRHDAPRRRPRARRVRARERTRRVGRSSARRTHRTLRGTGHARGTLHCDQRHGDATPPSRPRDAADTLARHCTRARARTIAPSGARKTRHFSRTFDGITLAAAMFDTVDGSAPRTLAPSSSPALIARLAALPDDLAHFPEFPGARNAISRHAVALTLSPEFFHSRLIDKLL